MSGKKGISRDCMDAIRKTEGGTVGKCNWDVNSPSCGPYQIKQSYWKDAGSPGKDYKSCTTDTKCSERTVQNYMGRYGQNAETCGDYGRLHNGGPRGMQNPKTEAYGQRVMQHLKK